MTAVRTPSRSTGFTLVELLAALVAGSLLLVWLSWAVGGVSDRWVRQQQPDPVLELAGERQAIVRLIEAALPEAKGAAWPDVTSGRLNLLVVPPLALRPVAMARLELAAVAGGGGDSRLVATYKDRDNGAPLAPPVTLAHGWRTVTLSRDQAGTPDTHPTYRLAFIAENGATYMILASPRITAREACIFDPIAGECRR